MTDPKPPVGQQAEMDALLLLCRETQRNDDRLGQYSDYEGDENGPTFHLWKAKGREGFALHCEMAIEDHRAAIRIWTKLKKLNVNRGAK